MDTRTLIDSIMRQATVLIAQLATASGVRAPLSHVADQVFADLARELESQGVRQKVVADMFGVALRTYQKRLRRMTEASGERDRTLWEAIVGHIMAEEPLTRAQLDERFQREEERDVAALLRDLVDSGLVYRTGTGAAAVYGMSSALDHGALSAARPDALPDFLWLAIYRHGPLSGEELRGLVPQRMEDIEAAVSRLLGDGRVARAEDGRYLATSVVIPVGASAGWEAAVFDHFQAVALAIAEKAGAGETRSREADITGGGTLTFDVHSAHPMRAEVVGLLRRVRAEANALWERVEGHNEAHPIADAERQEVTFYFGQFCRMPAEREERRDV